MGKPRKNEKITLEYAQKKLFELKAAQKAWQVIYESLLQSEIDYKDAMKASQGRLRARNLEWKSKL